VRNSVLPKWDNYLICYFSSYVKTQKPEIGVAIDSADKCMTVGLTNDESNECELRTFRFVKSEFAPTHEISIPKS